MLAGRQNELEWWQLPSAKQLRELFRHTADGVMNRSQRDDLTNP